MQCSLLFPAYHGLQPILGSIHPNSSSFLISFLYWRTPNWMPVLQVWFHRCQTGRNNPFLWPASCTVLMSARSSSSLLRGHAADSCSEPVPAYGLVVYQVYDFEFAFIELHNVSVIPFLLPVCLWGSDMSEWGGYSSIQMAKLFMESRSCDWPEQTWKRCFHFWFELHDSILEVLALDV